MKEVGRISIRVVPDTSKFRQRLRESLRQIENREEVTVGVGLDASGAKAHMRVLMAQLKAQAARGVDVSVGIDRNHLAALSGLLSRGMADIGSQAGKAFSSGLSAGIDTAGGAGKSGLAGAVGIGALVAAVAALLAPAIAAVSTALVSLPGVITAAVVPIGALALGMDGLKKAAAQLAAPLDHLKQVMAQKTQDVFTPILAKLQGLFPTLAAQLPKVTEGMGSIANSIVGAVSSATGLSRIGDTIKNVAAGLQTAAPGFGAFTQGLLGLATVFTEKLPAIGTWLSQIGTQFSEWVNKIQANGQLSAAFDNLGSSLKVVVGLIGDLVSKGIEWMSDPKFGQSMVKTFQDIRDAVNATMTVLGPMFQILSAGINVALAPLRLLTGEFEKLPLILQAPIQLIDKLVSSITGLFSGINWSGMWDGLTTAASAAWNLVKSAADDAWGSLISGAANAMSSMVSAVAEGVTNVVAKIGELGQQIAAKAASFGTLLVDAGRNLIQGLINGITSMVGAAISAASNLAGQVAGAVKGALGIHSPSRVFHEIGQNVNQGLVNGIREGTQEVTAAGKGMAENVKSGFGNEIDPGKYAESGVDMAKNFISSVGDQFMSDLGISGQGSLTAGGKQLMDWGIQQATGAVFNFQVSSVDEAMSIKDREASKSALSAVGR